MKEALFYKKLEKNAVQCRLCPHFCVIKPGERGKCRVRENRDGKLYSLVYGKPCSANIDPIEKKPLYHFLPGNNAFSISTVGCNLACKNCQNWQISQAKPEDIPFVEMPPKKVVEETEKEKCKIISYTYTDPIIFYEYMLDISKIAKKQDIKNTMVSNGFINQAPLKKLIPFLDGANIDLKSIDNEFYTENCSGKVKPVLDTLAALKKMGVWLEITNLMIPGKNDSLKDIKGLIDWISENLGPDVPLHFTAFYPCYQFLDIKPTPIDTLKQARIMAMDAGLHYVYTGNLPDDEGNTTFCPKCGKALIRRKGFYIAENNLVDGKCTCGEKIEGVWK